MVIDIVKKCISSEKVERGTYKSTFAVELYMTIENVGQKFYYTIEQITRKPIPVGFVEKLAFTEQMGSILTWMDKTHLKLKQAEGEEEGRDSSF